MRTTRRCSILTSALALALTPLAQAATRPTPPRRVITLDGTWEVAEGDRDRVPDRFERQVTVPGLIDLARPAFENVGTPSPKRQAFWYRRTFRIDGPIPDVARLKVHKARYGTRVLVNGQLAGEHLPCFTPGEFDVQPFLKGDGAENEVVIRVGADRDSMPRDVPSGWDFEKYRYIPGIYDSVDLILTGRPFVRNVQIVPDVASETVRAVVEIEAGPAPIAARVSAGVREARSGQATGASDVATRPLEAGATGTTELALALPGARTWSPEDPFLYELTLSTGGDAVAVRFGMRSFRFDPRSKRALLNGRPYYLRGTNVCIFRFFEDAQRADRPWREEWVRRLHRRFKEMNWNAIRYCIGFPPDAWYDIADEEGFLIQDEFPIWVLNPGKGRDQAPEFPVAREIIPQYVEWLRERWNHPCVVIWDGQNESLTDETGQAIRAVRHLDLSNRPWENGWGEPQSPTDCVESHPYLFSRVWSGQPPFRLAELAAVPGAPRLNDRQKARDVPIIINEYDWLWLNRDGTPTCLTDKVYASLLGPDSTTHQRREVHARYVAALTEFWRCHRGAAGVLHFCGLGYSRAGDRPRPEGGATSDHFVDLEALTIEPLIAEYVKDAFEPVGLMLDFWAEDVPAGQERSVAVVAINDRDADWSGTLRLRIVRDGAEVSSRAQPCTIPAFGRTVLDFPVAFPTEPGSYTMSAELARDSGTPTRSLRDFRIKP